MTRRIRVLIAKVGMDGHDRGAKVIARALRDAGMEVIYSGLFQSPESTARMAVQEDVDLVGVSILSGAHMSLLPPIRQELDRLGGGEILLVAGGTIPPDDAAALKAQGVAEVFTPGHSLEAIIRWIEAQVAAARGQAAW